MPSLTAELGVDLRDLPAYSYAEGARMVDVPRSTLQAWTRGMPYGDGQHFEPVLRPPEGYGAGLSYYNLVEATVLRALRTVHAVPLADVREAIEDASHRFGIERLLIHEEFRVSGKDLFLQRYSELIHLGRSGQMVLEELLRDTLMRVKYDEDRLALSHYPLTRGSPKSDPKIIEIHPYVAFGRAIVARRGISTRAIVSRIDAGESVEHVADDYDLTREEVSEAQAYEARMKGVAA
jgi:uncharacterized protein (DUF433 family)